MCLGLTITGVYLLRNTLIQELALSSLSVEVYQSSASPYNEDNEVFYYYLLFIIEMYKS